MCFVQNVGSLASQHLVTYFNEEKSAQNCCSPTSVFIVALLGNNPAENRRRRLWFDI
jgi:hypothetical protein